MTQPDNSPSERSLALAELRRVLSDTPPHVLLQDGPHATQPLRRAARALAEEARAHDAARAELLLIALRRTWRDLPETRRFEPHTHEELWDRLVTACIEEFYRPAREPR